MAVVWHLAPFLGCFFIGHFGTMEKTPLEIVSQAIPSENKMIQGYVE
ncbi:MAG: hypothetical protein OJF51_003051 [Nitrospira sp.]|jgi:hypothetical protein|nr:MAG: hypothetical protein OJF51_003051 [Nitrospira sp.]